MLISEEKREIDIYLFMYCYTVTEKKEYGYGSAKIGVVRIAPCEAFVPSAVTS